MNDFVTDAPSVFPSGVSMTAEKLLGAWSAGAGVIWAIGEETSPSGGRKAGRSEARLLCVCCGRGGSGLLLTTVGGGTRGFSKGR